jgi:lipopolysaccharide biosynthesis regulator YciM
MGFDLSWLLLLIPVVFALGWWASRLDRRQARGDPREAAAPYFKGLNLLLNEQQDKAIDAFIEAVQIDPDTVELHFALGNLFRRRGETERAVRVHEHLLQRGDLAQADRLRAQHALAQDFFKAGLFDRAEAAYQALRGSAYELEANLALLSLYERSRDWAQADAVAQQLEARGTGSFATRRAQYLCEQALSARQRGANEAAMVLLRQAQQVAAAHPRAHVLQGQWLLADGQGEAALQVFETLQTLAPGAFNLVAADYARAAQAQAAVPRATRHLLERHAQSPSLALLGALGSLDPAGHAARLAAYLQQQPSLNAARELLEPLLHQHLPQAAPDLLRALDSAARPLLRHRCAACGFESAHYFWQCPGCLSWDSFPPIPVEGL